MNDFVVALLVCWMTFVPIVVGAIILYKCHKKEDREF